MEYSGALYMRLSKDDGRDESLGIEGQRLLLREKAKSEGIRIYDEYVDDGYSGTRADRPALLRMLKDIELGRVNTVLVKDMSRLGRDHIATGELTEVYFPRMGVRFISVNDGCDSERGDDDMTPFRHVINEMYARDISKKIRSSLYAKMREGKYIGSFAPYGYKKCESDKGRLVLDAAAADVVKQIFMLRSMGKSGREIAEVLNGMAIPVPLDYRRLCDGRASAGLRWSASGVCKILRNPVYVGDTVQGKNKKPTLKSQRSYSMPREKWIVVENTHEPIISREMFNACQLR